MSEPIPALERTNSAVKLAEETVEGPSRTASYAATESGPPSAIGKAMEYTQPGSSKKLIAAEPSTGEETVKEKSKQRKSHKKKGKKEKAEKEKAENAEVVMKVTVKHLEERYDEQGYTHIHEPGVEPPEKTKEDKWADYVLCELRHFNYENKFTHRTLEVKSKHLKEVLKNIIGEYPGISFRTHKIKLEFPLRCLYHYLDELAAELEVLKKAKSSKKESKKDKGKKDKKHDKKKDKKKKDEEDSAKEEKPEEADEESKEEAKDEKKKKKEKPEDKEIDEKKKQKDEEEAIEHLEFLAKFLDDEFQETIRDIKNLLPHGLITYELLWTIFKPGVIVFAKTNNEQRALKLTRSEYVGGREAAFQLSLEYVDYDGKSFGLAEATIPIYPFQGSTKISALNAFPLSFHPREAAVRQSLIERGRRFEGYKGTHYMEYKGIGLGEVVRCRRVQYNINGRVMVDAATYDRINPERSISLSALSGDEKEPRRGGEYDYYDSDYSSDSGAREKCILNKDQDPLTDEQRLLAHFLVSGFALSEKKWVDFYIDNLTPIQWNSDAFDQLVLPASQKSLVKALVESHVRDVDGFDDIIKGKGKGLISILHGPPGVGKTLTAESVAEHTRRPLYAVSSGELGTNPTELEENLSRILDVATVWKAVLLLDEADVFLEKRSLHDLKRNSLVSIFLRLLEYYQGILFLTSNRVTSFDEAFQSRIHVALKYNKLDQDARTKVWKNFMKFDENKDGKMLLETVAGRELNGRQIKNCVRTARSLAEAEGKGVQLKHLKMVLDIQEQFEKDFGGLMGNGAED